MSLCLDTSKWAQTLWRSHCSHSPSARHLIAAGTRKQAQYAAWADDVHGALYLRQPPATLESAPAWATTLLQQAQELAEWKPLKARCMQSGFQAGLATEVLLRGLVGCVPQQRQSGDTPGKGEEGLPDPSGTRRRMRQAMRAAGEAVDEAEQAMEGIATAFGVDAGTEAGTGETLTALEHVRTLYVHLAHHDRLQQIAQLAGRLHRLAQSHKRSRGQSHVGAMTGVTMGGDLARILPSELAGLRGSRLARLQVLAKIQGRKALQYDVQAPVPEARGPILVCLDESSSMGGQRNLWAKAVALALLTICREERRAWGLIGFDAVVQRTLVVEPGDRTPVDTLMQVLLGFSGGGTDFDAPLEKALDVLRSSPVLHKADLIFVTDGASEVSAGVAQQVNAVREAEGLSVYVVGVGTAAKLASLAPIATATFHLSSRPQDNTGAIVPLLAQVA